MSREVRRWLACCCAVFARLTAQASAAAQAAVIKISEKKSSSKYNFTRTLRTTPPLQEQHRQLPPIFPYLPLTELSLPCVMSSPPTLRSLPPSDDLATPTPAANSKNSKGSDTANTSRPPRRHYRPFPHTRLEFFRFSSDSDIHNFFFFY